MAKRSLINKAKTSEFQKGIHDNVLITNVDIKDRKGTNGPINKMIYIKFAQFKDGKKVAESELSWWKPDVNSEYFKTNLQELCLQIHNVLEVFIGEDAAFDAFANVFDVVDITDQKEIESRKWKQSEATALLTGIKDAFNEAITPFVNNSENLIRVKLTTDYKGEGIEMPKYGKFIEPMSTEETKLKFTANELKTHSKAGNVTGKDAGQASSSNTSATI